MSSFAIWAGPLPAAIDRVVSLPPSQTAESQLQGGEAAIAVDDDVQHDTHFIAEISGEPVAALRPTIPAPPAFAAGVAATWADLPEGAVLRFVDADGAPEITVDETNEVAITFAAGSWTVEAVAEFPWVSETFAIEVE
ncbi:hypothetical protein [Pikeienuella sp. HZG-20]|uniref:hypothetical protein n=1 Tax=Paludibacillus litoralis TaxID=3133267 RepID=UPI0030EF4E4A